MTPEVNYNFIYKLFCVEKIFSKVFAAWAHCGGFIRVNKEKVHRYKYDVRYK